MLRVTFIIIAFLCAVQLSAQGNIQIKEEANITQMMSRFTEINKSKTRVDGWRVQVLATPDRQELERVRQVFQYKYPNINIDWVHNSPYYKLRAGAFATKLEAIRLQYLLRRDYPSAYLVKDNNLRPAELVSSRD